MNKLIFAFLLLAGTTASAEITITSTNLIPADQQHELIPSYNFVSLDVASTVSGFSAKSTSSGSVLGISYGYGLMPDQALQVATSYGMTTSTNSVNGVSSADTKADGLGSLDLAYRMNFDMGLPTLYVAPFFNVMTSKAKEDTVANKDTYGPSQHRIGAQAALIFRRRSS